ncbi:MAG: helix-turn-helix domain-containing protein, partial [Pseudonocardia sp.]
MTRTYDSPVRRERAAATRRAILEAFAEQFGRPGTTDVAIPEAAERAGVSARTVYHHFPDR